MTFAFWDASALVPLCVQQGSSGTVQELRRKFEVAAWWATPVEVRSALERLVRLGQMTPGGYSLAEARLERLRRTWLELEPTEELRSEAEAILTKYPPRAADALQLAAARAWSSGEVKKRTFISGDVRLVDAARQDGFQVLLV